MRFVGLVRSVGRSPSLRTDPPTHKPSRILFVTSHGYFRQENIRESEITLCVQSTKKKRKKRKVDQGIFFSSSSSSSLCRRLSAVARSSPWRDTWFPLSKRRSSFVKRLWIFFFFFFLERLLLSPHGCPQFKRSRLRRLSCGLYYLRSRM